MVWWFGGCPGLAPVIGIDVHDPLSAPMYIKAASAPTSYLPAGHHMDWPLLQRDLRFRRLKLNTGTF